MGRRAETLIISTTENNMSIIGKKWKIENENPSRSLFEKLLDNRNITEEIVADFLNPDLKNGFHNPFLMKNMRKSIERIKKAIKNQERIIIFGDYDTDGISGTAILVHTLQDLNANISYRLPHRVTDGYGINTKFIEEFAKIGIDLIITVDCGIACDKQIKLAKEYGIDVIVTDHHTIPQNFPREAYAILHPGQKSCDYPFDKLTGAGVAFKLAQALIRTFYKRGTEEKEEELLDLACLGTIADLGELTGENRLIVKRGLESLKKTKWRGLKSLKVVARIDEQSKIDTHCIGYYLAPRLNAAGRIDTPYLALQLLLNQSEKADLFAKKLERLNQERQRLTRLAMDQIEEDLKDNIHKQKILVAYNQNWHTGILGLIAGKLADKYGRPCIIMEDRGEELVGSARGPESICLMEILNQAGRLLDHFGGHRQAAGFRLKKQNLESFIEKINNFADKKFKLEELKPLLNIDCEVTIKDLNLDTYHQIEKLAPFGVGNKRPLFILKDISISAIKNVGKDGKHLKFTTNIGTLKFDTIGFGLSDKADQIRNFRKTDIVCYLDENNWNGARMLQLQAVDLAKTQ